jgi:hypothetical protein
MKKIIVALLFAGALTALGAPPANAASAYSVTRVQECTISGHVQRATTVYQWWPGLGRYTRYMRSTRVEINDGGADFAYYAYGALRWRNPDGTYETPRQFGQIRSNASPATVWWKWYVDVRKHPYVKVGFTAPYHRHCLTYAHIGTW